MTKKMKVIFYVMLLGISIILGFSKAVYPKGVSDPQHDWKYVGENGPAKWGKLNNTSQACSMGRRQSPVDIDENIVKKNKSLPKINFSYLSIPLEIDNNGHTIQINYPKGSNISIGNASAELLQFHFHTPSEHAFDGKRSEMEVHFVNKKEDGSLAVVGILMKKGKKNKALEALFKHFPKKKGTHEMVTNALISPMDFIPKDDEYYTYTGSLTTPPCSEPVTWYVLKEKIELSFDQIKKFRKLFPMNSRPLQSLSQRIIEEKD